MPASAARPCVTYCLRQIQLVNSIPTLSESLYGHPQAAAACCLIHNIDDGLPISGVIIILALTYAVIQAA